ncbi:MAG: TIGR03643 family protein [Polyangiaceae bacterium]|nr:TIGR03643 family protein [Polyangiaceae bacterium]
MARKGDTPYTRTKHPEPPGYDDEWLIWAAWADRVSFEEIQKKTGLAEPDVIIKMRRLLAPKTFRRWRKRAHTVSLKHQKKFRQTRREWKNVIPEREQLDIEGL